MCNRVNLNLTARSYTFFFNFDLISGYINHLCDKERDHVMFIHAQEYPITANDTYPRKYTQNRPTRTQASPTNIFQWRAGPDATSSPGRFPRKNGRGSPGDEVGPHDPEGGNISCFRSHNQDTPIIAPFCLPFTRANRSVHGLGKW